MANRNFSLEDIQTVMRTEMQTMIKTELATGLATEREHTKAMFAAEREHMDGRFNEILTATAEVISSVTDHMDERFEQVDRRFDEASIATADVISAVNDNVDAGFSQVNKRFDRLDRVVGVHSKDITELRSHLA